MGANEQSRNSFVCAVALMQFPARAPSNTAAPAPIVKSASSLHQDESRIDTFLLFAKHAWLSNGDFRAYWILVHAVRNKFWI